jgi:hypothetical protein
MARGAPHAFACHDESWIDSILIITPENIRGAPSKATHRPESRTSGNPKSILLLVLILVFQGELISFLVVAKQFAVAAPGNHDPHCRGGVIRGHVIL